MVPVKRPKKYKKTKYNYYAQVRNNVVKFFCQIKYISLHQSTLIYISLHCLHCLHGRTVTMSDSLAKAGSIAGPGEMLPWFTLICLVSFCVICGFLCVSMAPMT